MPHYQKKKQIKTHFIKYNSQTINCTYKKTALKMRAVICC